MVVNSGNGGGWQADTLANIPSTCSVGAAYFATEQPANQQLYTCSAPNTWTQNLMLGNVGGLKMTNGALDINTAVVPQLGVPNQFTALNEFVPGLMLDEQPSVGTPASGKDNLYINSSDHQLHMVNSAGQDVVIGAGGGSSIASGQVAYGSSSGLTGSPNLFWDSTNGRLGIGTNSPSQMLSVVTSVGGVVPEVLIQSNNAAAILQFYSSSAFSGVALDADFSSFVHPFSIQHDGTAHFDILSNGDTFLGGSITNTSSGAGANVTVKTSEGGHVYTHGASPAVAGGTLEAGNDVNGIVDPIRIPQLPSPLPQPGHPVRSAS